MDEPTPSPFGDVLQEIQSRFGAPAYVRRARQVQEAFDALLDSCRVRREERLAMVRTRLGLLHALAGDWEELRPLMDGEDPIEALRRMQDELRPRLRTTVEPTMSPRALRRALKELRESITRFNRLWREFLAGLDLSGVNALRDDYNRYYLLEKECALRSPRLARVGYQPLPPVTAAELEALLPPLPVP